MWKQIADYPNYEVSTEGEIRNSKTNLILKSSITKFGYRRINLTNGINRKAIFVHRLVAMAFIPLVEGKLLIDHIDKNKINNNVSNLRWVTPSENNDNRDYYSKDKKELHHICNTPSGKYNVTFRLKNIPIHKKLETLEEAILYRDEFMKNNPR